MRLYRICHVRYLEDLQTNAGGRMHQLSAGVATSEGRLQGILD